MPAVAAHGFCGEQLQSCEEPADDGEFKDYAHNEQQHEEGRDIGTQRDDIGHIGGDLVGGQKAEGEREDDEVGQQEAAGKEEVAGGDGAEGEFAFVGVEGGTDETEEDKEDIGGNRKEGGPKGYFHMDEELLGEFDIDHLNLEGGQVADDTADEAVGDKTVGLGGEEHGEQGLFESESDNGKKQKGDEDADKASAQRFEMVPEGHL